MFERSVQVLSIDDCKSLTRHIEGHQVLGQEPFREYNGKLVRLSVDSSTGRIQNRSGLDIQFHEFVKWH